MIEQKLSTIQQGPEDIFECLLLVGALAEREHELIELFAGRLAGEAAEVKVDESFLGKSWSIS